MFGMLSRYSRAMACVRRYSNDVMISRSAPIAALRGDFDAAAAGLRRFGLRSVLVAGQVALSTVCLVATVLFLWSLRNALQIDPGFTTDDLLAVTFDLDGQGLGPEEGRQLVRRIVEQVEALPGVRSAAVAASLPLDPDAPRLMRTAVLEGGGKTVEESPIVQMNTVGMGYFDTLGIPVLAGRGFTEDDRPEGRAVVVVNPNNVPFGPSIPDSLPLVPLRLPADSRAQPAKPSTVVLPSSSAMARSACSNACTANSSWAVTNTSTGSFFSAASCLIRK